MLKLLLFFRLGLRSNEASCCDQVLRFFRTNAALYTESISSILTRRSESSSSFNREPQACAFDTNPVSTDPRSQTPSDTHACGSRLNELNANRKVISKQVHSCGIRGRMIVNPSNPANQSVWQSVVRLVVTIFLMIPLLSRTSAAGAGKPLEQAVLGFLAKHCQKCHGATQQEGRLTLENISTGLASGQDLSRWQKVLDRLDAGEMPPDTEPRPAVADVRQVLDWVRAGLQKAEAAGHSTSRRPRPGNTVKHSLLFDPKYQTVSIPGPPRVWRLSPHIYQRLVWDLDRLRKAEVFNPFPVTSAHGFSDQSALYTIDETAKQQLIRNAQAVVGIQTGFQMVNGKLTVPNDAVKDFASLFDPGVKLDDAVIDAAVQRQFELALLRPPTAAEAQRFAGLMKKNIATAGRELGARGTLAAILLLPEVNFRLEIGREAAPDTDRVQLTPRETAFAISYTLSDSRPHRTPHLWIAARRGQLETKEQVSVQVRAILDNPRIHKEPILRFFREYFGYAEAVNVFKDEEDFPDHLAKQLVADTDLLVKRIVAEDKNVLLELLTTDRGCVNALYIPYKDRIQRATSKKVHLSYNLEQQPLEQPIKLPRTQRAGILTQPSWLVAHSSNFDNHAIRRGKWIRERLLGGTVPDLPITVDATLPDDPKMTLRERMQITQEAYCWQCHKKMNDLGLAFENYDHFGRHRTSELGKPVDPGGIIADSGDPKLDGRVKDSLELIRRLAVSTRVRQVFVRHAFRFFLGRNETPGDAKTLQEADKAYVDSGGSFKALVTALIASDAFLYRSVYKGGHRRTGFQAGPTH